MPSGLLSGTGLYGKLPATGDFIARGVEAGFRHHLDQWITLKVLPVIEAGMFPDEGLRLIIPAAGIAGAMIDSRDKVGRRYPLVALTVIGERTGPVACDGWAEAALDALRAGRDEGAGVEDIFTSLAALTPPEPDGEGPSGLTVWTADRTPAGSLADLLEIEISSD